MVFTENQTFTYFEVLQRASSFLREKEASPFVAEWLMRERLDWSKTDLVMHYKKNMPLAEQKQFINDLSAFLKGRPMQQIIGHEWFYDRKFLVTADTLIPRPETEEWLDHVLNKLPNRSLSVLDIGTGTGVIGITVKLEKPDAVVTATDISEPALNIAKENAQRLGADINFKCGDVFEPVKDQTFDLILSNPPYISRDELSVMDESVIRYEPKTALFAEEEGLAIYKKLAKSLNHYLNEEGFAFFEIGYKQGESVATIFKQALPQAYVEIYQDFNGLDRVVAVYKQSESVK